MMSITVCVCDRSIFNIFSFFQLLNIVLLILTARCFVVTKFLIKNLTMNNMFKISLFVIILSNIFVLIHSQIRLFQQSNCNWLYYKVDIDQCRNYTNALYSNKTFNSIYNNGVNLLLMSKYSCNLTSGDIGFSYCLWNNCYKFPELFVIGGYRRLSASYLISDC